MKSRILSFAATLMIGVGMSLSSHASFQDPSQVQNLPPNTPEKPLYLPYGNEPTVVGTIKVNGQVPAPIRIDTTADPVCGQINPTLKSDSIVARQQQLQNAFVYIKEGEALKNYRFEVPESEVTLAHLKCRFSPHVLGLRVGQRLSIVNGDPTQHNTHPTPKLNPEWNQTNRKTFLL